MAESRRTGSTADNGESTGNSSAEAGERSGPAKKAASPTTTRKSESRSDSTTGARGKPGDSSDTTEPARGQRLGEKLTAAHHEHRANARPDSSAASTKASRSSGLRAPRRARLRLTRLDPWSVMKTAFLLSIAIGVVTIVSVMIVWSVLGAAGVWDSINATVADVVGTQETSDFDVENYIGLSRVLGFTILVSAIDVVLITAIATLMAFLYNMAAALLGGVEVTLAEDQP